jgi:predicted PurR-regulated permease PerM
MAAVIKADSVLAEAPERASRAPSAISIVIVTLMVIATLRLGRAVVLPVVIALLLTVMLSAPVRWLHGKRVPARVAAALVLFGALGAGLGVAALLVSPAMQWIASAPETIKKVEAKVRHLAMPLTVLQRSADRMQAATASASASGDTPRTVQLATPGIVTRVSLETVAAIPIALTAVFLTYFLLANGALFRRKLAGLLPGRQELKRREHLLSEIEIAASHFLVTVAAVNAGVGVLTALALWAVGVPTPLLWGLIAAALNFVPYLGPVVTAAVIALVALAGVDDPARALIAPAAFVVIHLTEANFITPTLLGRHLPVNTVAIFLGLLFFGGIWGIPGAVLAVPLTVCAKLVCDHVPSLAHVGELLDN